MITQVLCNMYIASIDFLKNNFCATSTPTFCLLKLTRLDFMLCKCPCLHSRNLLFAGDFQGPALVVILEGANLSRDEVAGLQFLPPWRLRGDTMNYGLGLLSCFSISDFVSVVSDGILYMFDPKGLALAMPSHHAPAAKMFLLRGTYCIVILPGA